MSHYYEENDLERFKEIGKHCPELFDYFMNYYQGVMAAGALTVREKALISPGRAHSVPVPLLHRRLHPGLARGRLQYGER